MKYRMTNQNQDRNAMDEIQIETMNLNEKKTK